ncbi:DUF58 domain-containing protein [soil metagenome]
MLDPVLLLAIHDLEVVARVTVEGALSGLHRSPFHGYSAEFSQYRHYRPGDDLKYVDWKLFARTDRVYTKQFRETTNLRMQIVLDASASMGFGAGVSKLEYARLVAAGFAHLLVTQGDAVGLMVHDEEIRSYLGARGGRTHLRALLAALSNVQAQGRTGGTLALRRSIDLLRTRGVLLVLSDLYDDEDGVDAELRRAARIGHEVIVFPVLTPDEVHPRIRGATEFEDAETGLRVIAGAAALVQHQRQMAAFIERWRDRCATYGIDYCGARTDAPLDATLRGYLLQRGRAPRR